MHSGPIRSAMLAAGLAALLGLAGCGAEEEVAAPAAQATPTSTATADVPADPAPKVSAGAGTRRRLAAGDPGVVDFAGKVGIEPARLRPNAEQELRGMRWSGWGEAEAVGRGTVETLDCSPSCGQGLVSEAPATLTLSSPRVCGDERYYGEARLVFRDTTSGQGAEPAVYLRTPC